MMQTNKTRGFTLVETLVAITVLLMTIVGPFYSIQQSLVASYAARDQIIASALAQEALEYVYSVRDDNYLAGRPWLSGISTCLNAVCTVDLAQNTLSACASGGCAPLKLGSDSRYTQGTGTVTRFTRSLSLAPVNGSTDMQVAATVTVTWSTGRRPYTVTITQNLYNWL